MTDTATPAVADAITPANILEPVSVPPPVTAPESKPSTAQPEAAPPKAEDTGTADAAKEDQDEPKRNSAKARISELYAQKKAAERDAQSKAQRVYQLEQELSQLRQQSQANPDDWQLAQRNDARAAVKEERMAELRDDAIRQMQEAANLRQKGWETKVETARERFPDMDEALETFKQLPVTDYAADIIAESDKAAEITYFLAKNPSEAYRIANLPPHQQGRALAQLEAKVSVAQPRKTSTAPPPVPMVTASSAPATPALRDMGVADIGKLLGY